MKYITQENYKEFKPSEFVHSFISDIDVAIKLGKPMDMDWYQQWDGCMPCLGGMACMNLGIGVSGLNDLEDNISRLGDAIRNGNNIGVVNRLDDLYYGLIIPYSVFDGLDTTEFNGKIKTKEQFKALKAQVMKYVVALEKAGY
jgi:hypothetical protein